MTEVELAERRREMSIKAHKGINLDILADRDKLVAMLERGMTPPQIAAVAGCGDGTVRDWMDVWGIPRRHDVSRARMAELHRQGLGLADIGRELGCSEATVRRGLERLGLQRTRPVKSAIDEAELRAMHGDGLSVKQIAKRMHRWEGTVRNRLREMELVPMSGVERKARKAEAGKLAIARAYARKADRCWSGCPGWDECLDGECVL